MYEASVCPLPTQHVCVKQDIGLSQLNKTGHTEYNIKLAGADGTYDSKYFWFHLISIAMPTENGVIWHPVKQAPDVTEKLLFENGLYKGQNGSSPSDDSSSCSDHKQTVHLEKKIGLFSGVGLIVGTMIGTYKVCA